MPGLIYGHPINKRELGLEVVGAAIFRSGPTVEDTTSASAASGTTITIDVPADTQENDWLITAISRNGPENPTADDSDWGVAFADLDQGAAAPSLTVWAKRATGSEPSSYTWTHLDVSHSVMMFAVRGVGYVGISDAVASGAATTGSLLNPDVGQNSTTVLHIYSGGDALFPVTCGLDPAVGQVEDAATGITAWTEIINKSNPPALTVTNDASDLQNVAIVHFGPQKILGPLVVGNELVIDGSASTDTFTVNVPAETQEGDLLVAFHARPQVTIEYSVPVESGWTLAANAGGTAGNDKGITIWWRYATDSEPSNYSFQTDVDYYSTVHLLAIRGAHATNPIDSVSGWAHHINNASPRLPQEQSRTSNALRLDVAYPSTPGTWSGAILPPPQYTVVSETVTDGEAYCSTAILSRPVPAIGTQMNNGEVWDEILFLNMVVSADSMCHGIVIASNQDTVAINENFEQGDVAQLAGTILSNTGAPRLRWQGPTNWGASSGFATKTEGTRTFLGLPASGFPITIEANIIFRGLGQGNELGIWYGNSENVLFTNKITCMLDPVSAMALYVHDIAGDSGSFTPVIDTEYTFRIEYDGTDVEFFIDDVSKMSYTMLASNLDDVYGTYAGIFSRAINDEILSFSVT